MSNLGLPPVPPPLKVLLPYIQRADELRQKEPIVAYWCAYYAAQLGISLKVKDDASRTLLLDLLDALENLKKEIGPNDAIDMESASAAYVENFALKVFGMADNEDRRGDGSRSTAKKFLAAANFLEVLKTFPKTEISESTEEKIRYSKWKAADIAKAYREGRKPTPGPAGGEKMSPGVELDLPVVPPTLTSNNTDVTISTNTTVSSGSTFKLPSPSTSPTTPSRLSPPAIKRSSPPPILDEIPPAPPFTPPRALLGINSEAFDPTSPGSWSTAATPGAVTVRGTPTDDSPPPFAAAHAGNTAWPADSPTPATKTHKSRRGSQSSTGSANSLGSAGSGGARKRTTSLSPKKVHFTLNESSAPISTSTPPAPPVFGHPPAETKSSSPTFVPQSNYSSQPPPPPSHPNSYPHPNTSLPPSRHPQQPVHPSAPHHTPSAPPPPPAPAPAFTAPHEVELTPSVVAKAQKHCRFAISALDYEDAEQARKELRAALAVLGG